MTDIKPVDYEKMTVAELRIILKEKGLKVSGKKSELIQRLKDNKIVETNQFFVEVFGQKYPLTKEQINDSNFLKSAFGLTGFKKTEVVKLDFSDEVKPAFEFIYKKIRLESVPGIKKDKFYDIVVLEGYLDVPLVYSEIKMFLIRSNFTVDFYTNLYTAKYSYPKELLNILEDKILKYALNINDIPDKLINKIGLKNIANIFIEKSKVLENKLQQTERALDMRVPTYWEDFSFFSNSTLAIYKDKIREKMDSIIDLDNFLDEAEHHRDYFEVEALAKLEESNGTSILSDYKSAKLFKFLVKHKLVNSLKNIDDIKLDIIKEIVPEEVISEYEKLMKQEK